MDTIMSVFPLKTFLGLYLQIYLIYFNGCVVPIKYMEGPLFIYPAFSYTFWLK